MTLATILACRQSAEGSNAEVLAHLKEIQSSQQKQDSANNKLETIIEVLSNTIQNQTGETQEAFKSEIGHCLKAIDGICRDLQKEDVHNILRPEGQICKWLDFRQLSWRYELVYEAYHDTYGWIFENPTDYQKWGDFNEYLRSVNTVEPYFINGKAGSGKSTLMKFILQHERTTSALTQWAGSDYELMMIHFFFWNTGESLQKTHVGMLRGLLYAVLDKYPELVPAVFPKLYRGWNQSIAKSQPEYVELKVALSLLISKAHFLKLAIFIDGVDEFEGDHSDMSHFLRSLVSKNVKLVVSSRPINACLETFANSPSLRLQDLTRPDMESFVRGELSSEKEMTALMEEYPDQAPHLGTAILQKAEGVFLWVKLVVGLLVKGLRDGDTIGELYATLESLPSDLKDLYQRMFDSLPPKHQVEAAHTFRLERVWRDLFTQPLPALALSFALSNPSEALAAPCVPVTYAAAILTVKRLAKRVRSRCVGLLEVALETKDQCKDHVGSAYIQYHHQTVAEFLRQDDIWQSICGKTQSQATDPHLCLASACLSMMKLADTEESRVFRLYLFQLTHVLRDGRHLTAEAITKYVKAVDEMTSSLHMASKKKAHCVLQSRRPELDYKASNEPTRMQMFAAGHALQCNRSTLSSQYDANARLAILSSALSSWFHVGERDEELPMPSLADRKKVLEHHLKHTVATHSWASLWSLSWQQAIEMCIAHCTKDPADLLLVFLESSENPRRCWQESRREWAETDCDPSLALGVLQVIVKETPSDHHLVDAVMEIERLVTSDELRPGPNVRPNGTRGKKRKGSQSSKKRKKRHVLQHMSALA